MNARSEKSAPAPMASTRSDLRQMSTNSKASVAELKSFLRELKGKSPQEMLGVVAASQLVRSIMLSTILVITTIGIFTVIPFFLKEPQSPGTAQSAPPAAPPANEKASVPATPPAPAKPAEPLSELGVGEERQAPPNINPLESKSDDFLKDLE